MGQRGRQGPSSLPTGADRPVNAPVSDRGRPCHPAVPACAGPQCHSRAIAAKFRALKQAGPLTGADRPPEGLLLSPGHRWDDVFSLVLSLLPQPSQAPRTEKRHADYPRPLRLPNVPPGTELPFKYPTPIRVSNVPPATQLQSDVLTSPWLPNA